MSSPAASPAMREATELVATPPHSSSSQNEATTPQGAPPNGGALDELRRKMLFRQGGSKAPPSPMNVNGELQPHPPSSPGGRSVSPGSGSSIVGGTGGLVHKANLNMSQQSDGSGQRGRGGSGGGEEHAAEQLRSALFEGRALPIRVISGGDLRGGSSEDQQTSDPHKLFQLLRKKKRATPQSSSRPFVPFQPPPDEGAGVNPRPGEQRHFQSDTVSGGGGSPLVSEGNSPSKGTSSSSGTGDVHNTPPRPSGSIPSRRPMIGRKMSADLSVVGQGIHPQSAPSGSSGGIIPPTAIAGGGGGGGSSAASGSAKPSSPAEHNNERPTSRVGSASQLKREVSSAGLHGRPCTRQKHPKKSLDLFDNETSKKDEELFPSKQRRSSSSLQQAPPPPGGSSNNGITTVPSPTAHRATAGGGGGGPSSTTNEGDPNNISMNSVTAALMGQDSSGKKDDVNFNCLFVQDEDEFGGDADAFPTAPQRSGSNIPLIETDWFTTDSWEPLACSDGHEVKDCDTEDYAESLYELLKQSSTRKASFKK